MPAISQLYIEPAMTPLIAAWELSINVWGRRDKAGRAERGEGFRCGFGGLDVMADCVEAIPSASKFRLVKHSSDSACEFDCRDEHR